MTGNRMTINIEHWHWVRFKNSSAPFEPAAVDYRDGKPYEVWVAGSDFSAGPDEFEIAEEVTRSSHKEK